MGLMIEEMWKRVKLLKVAKNGITDQTKLNIWGEKKEKEKAFNMIICKSLGDNKEMSCR